MSDQPQQPSSEDLLQVEKLQTAYAAMKAEMSKVIVGQDQVIDELFIALFCRGHCLLIGVPGLAKTLMISTLSRILSLNFNRIQFTPDLMPSDITGTEVIQEDKAEGTRSFRFLPGPVFANVILADEINRTPPKTQAALLEAMQEHHVTVGGTRHDLEEPFFVLATQNPIEQEGTYPLPEAQLDRFMFMVQVDYPELDEEREILRRTTEIRDSSVDACISAEDIMNLQEIVRRVPISDHVLDYALKLTRSTRITSDDAPDWIKEHLSWGAGPRASQYLVLGAKAHALLQNRFYVSADDIRTVAYPVLRHRLVTSFSAEAEGVTPDTVIDRLLEEFPANESDALADGKLPKVIQQ
ncbi:MAG: MoxR family ATPase [Planctomycetota bacterium]|jgi:MoxR-like ATPase|nr:MoxR family ATPase [Planctomycetota bacterium]